MRRCLALFAIPLAACADQAPPSTAVVRDSAGVRIVEHSADYTVPSWRLSNAPLLDIGAVAGDSSTLLYQVEGIHHLSDGRIVVANRSSHELRYYDPDGRYLHSVGREGGGPGEFGYIAWTVRCHGDSIFTWDITHYRMSVFDERGSFVRSFKWQLPNDARLASRATCQRDGTLLAAGRVLGTPVAGPDRPSITLALVKSDGSTLLSLGQFPGQERYGWAGDGTLSIGPHPLGLLTLHTIGNDQVYLGTGETYEISVYSLDGDLQTVIRKEVTDLALTDQDVERFIQGALRPAPNDNLRRSWERRFREMEFPSTLPAYSAFLLDDPGNLWVQDYLRPGDDQPVWNVFGPNGVQVAVVSSPPGLHVYEIGADYVLGKWQDEFDVEHVQLYDLIKPER